MRTTSSSSALDTKYYSSTNLFYKVLLCTTKYYSSTTLYYKSSINLYYKVLLQYHPVLQSTSWLIRITYETSFTMRGATKGSLQLQQILRLPCKMNLMIDPHRIWNVIYNARSNSQHPPTSPNTALATQNESHDWSTSHMKRHLQCAEQQSTPSNLAKYCACHAKGMTVLFLLTYATSFTMRGATGISLQPHQILRLPRKRNVMIDPHHIWNVIYASTSNLTKYCACHAKLHSQILEKFTENSWSGIYPMRDRSEHDPTMIRDRSDPEKRKTEPAAPPRLLFRTRQEQILLKITTFPAPAIIPNFTTCCACHEKWHMNFTKCCACHAKWHMNSTKCCACHTKVTHELHQMLRLPRKVTRSDTWLLLLLHDYYYYYYYYMTTTTTTY